MSRHVPKVNRVAIGRNQSRRSIVVWQCEWDGGSGFGCATTLPAPKNFLFPSHDIPERKTGPKYPYDQLELGDSFYLEGGDLSKLCNANYREWRRTGKKFTARKVENGVRVWRIECSMMMR